MTVKLTLVGQAGLKRFMLTCLGMTGFNNVLQTPDPPALNARENTHFPEDAPRSIGWHGIVSIDSKSENEQFKTDVMKQQTNVSPRAEQGNTQDNNTKKIVPQTNPAVNPATNTGGSMSEGNLSNSRYGRERTRAYHDKTTVMGSDTDGQAN